MHYIPLGEPQRGAERICACLHAAWTYRGGNDSAIVQETGV